MKNIKFEGPQKGNQRHEMVSVNQEGKSLYILNYVKRPSSVKDGDVVFMAAGIEDRYGKPQQVIIGRGHLCGYVKGTEVLSDWVEKYSWMNHYKYYVVLRDFETIDNCRESGLLLERVLIKVGSDTYEASKGQDRDLSQLKRMHTQKMHMHLTEEAREYINTQLDDIFSKNGSVQYFSEL